MAVNFRTEKDILREIIEYYKNSPCLWDTSDAHYRDKKARSAAISVLVEKWKTIAKEANPEFVKKKLENMRTTFVRERRKVEANEYAGRKYKPVLWYYEYMTFLTETPRKPRDSSTEEDGNDDTSARRNTSTGDHIYCTPKRKSILKSILTRTTDLPAKETQVSPQLTAKDTSRLHSTTKKSNLKIRRSFRERMEQKRLKLTDTDDSMIGSEPDATDYTALAMSHQLKDMTRVQRCIAEKMIADVIFYGKLEQLTPSSSINLDSTAPSQHYVVVQNDMAQKQLKVDKYENYEEYLDSEVLSD